MVSCLFLAIAAREPRRFMRPEPLAVERLLTRSARFGIVSWCMVVLILLNYDMGPWESHKWWAGLQEACRLQQNVESHNCVILQGLWSHSRVEQGAEDAADEAEDRKRTWLNLSEVVETKVRGDWQVQVVRIRIFFRGLSSHTRGVRKLFVYRPKYQLVCRVSSSRELIEKKKTDLL